MSRWDARKGSGLTFEEGRRDVRSGKTSPGHVTEDYMLGRKYEEGEDINIKYVPPERTRCKVCQCFLWEGDGLPECPGKDDGSFCEPKSPHFPVTAPGDSSESPGAGAEGALASAIPERKRS